MVKNRLIGLLPSLSTLLIIVGVICMALGTLAAFQYRPRPLTQAEQAALREGERLASEPSDSQAPVFLPSPGIVKSEEHGEITSLDVDAAPASQPAASASAESEAVAVGPQDNPAAPAPARPGPDDESGIARRQVEPTPTDAPTPLPVATSIPSVNPPTRIAAPTIGLDSKVLEVGWRTFKQGNQWFSEWETADYAVGFHKLSALIGRPGNTVFSGHNNIKGEVFRNLVDLNVGDPISVWADDREYKYIVTDKFIVREVGASMEQRIANAKWISPTEDERITLVSCWPYWTNTHRVVVIARPEAVAEAFKNKLAINAPDVPTGGADCPARPAQGPIGDVWQNNEEIRKRLGCAVAKAAPAQTTQQFFQGGRMIWRPDSASISVLYDDGRWQSVTSFNGLQPQPATPSTENCAVAPKLGFERVWTGLVGARSKLGCAAGGEQGLNVSAQTFEGGTALVFDTIPVFLFRDGSWAAVRP